MNVFDPTEIEETVGALLRDAGVSQNVFYNRPKSSTADLASFVVCRVSGGIRDRFTFGQCVLSISLFARNVENKKNSKKLSIMQDKCLAAVPRIIDDKIITDGTPTVVGDMDDRNGYHARLINYKVTIKAT